jgi:hypothetical protein
MTMPLDSAVHGLSPSRATGGRSPVLVVAASLCPGKIAPAIAAADVVFCEDGVDGTILTNAPRSTWIERLPVNGAGLSAQASAIARAHKLAADGWRVVLLVADAPNHRTVDLAEADTGAGCGQTPASATLEAFTPTRDFEPRLLATPFNGLAG